MKATFHTSIGDITVQLFEADAPKAVANFVGLATGTKPWRHPKSGARLENTPLFAGTTFHRCIPNFMIQGGDPYSRAVDGDPAKVGAGTPGYTFEDEIRPHLRFDRPGLLAMANDAPRRKNSNGCQFFLTETAAPHLTGLHTIFGEVIEGFRFIPKIARSQPEAPVRIERVTVTLEAVSTPSNAQP